MKTRGLGQSGIDAGVVAFGAWAIGGWKWGGTDASDSIAAIRAALDGGMSMIDTAAVYGFGLSEELVGQAIVGRKREDIVIATKCGLRWDLETPTLHAESEGRRICRTLDSRSMQHELDASLKRLGVSYIDLYQTHWPDPATPLDAVVETLESMLADGRIRSWGFCNSDPSSLEIARESGALSVDQERYSLLDREQDALNLPVCKQHGLAFLAYSPIAQGLLTGRIDSKREFVKGDLRRENPRFAPRVLEALQAVLAPVKSLARDREVSVEQLVLAWTLARPGVTHVLVGTRNAHQAAANAEAGRLELSADEIDLIDHAADAWPGFDSLADAADD